MINSEPKIDSIMEIEKLRDLYPGTEINIDGLTGEIHLLIKESPKSLGGYRIRGQIDEIQSSIDLIISIISQHRRTN